METIANSIEPITKTEAEEEDVDEFNEAMRLFGLPIRKTKKKEKKDGE